MANNIDTEEHKTASQRSASYPSYLIPQSYEFTKKVHSLLGTTAYHTREAIAKVLNLSTGGIQGHLSSANQYGLLEMVSKKGYKPSSLFLKLHKPLSEQEKVSAMIECLKSPKLYQGLLLEFQNDIVPSAPGLASILFRKYAIAEKASEGAAEIFLENLKLLNLLDAENHLVKSLYADGAPGSDNAPAPPIDKPVDGLNDTVSKGEAPIVIPLGGGRVAKLIVPLDVADADLKRIERFVKALKSEDDVV